jgi:hypothetical protein
MTNRLVVVLSVVLAGGAVYAAPPQQNPSKDSAIARFMQDYANRHPAAGAPATTVNNAAPVVPNRIAPRTVQKQPLCSIPLQSMPIDRQKGFAIQQFKPKNMDARSVIEPSAPTCNKTPNQR